MLTSVLITGGAGFLGCALARRLDELEIAVTVLDVLHPQVHPGGRRPADLPARVALLVGDVTDPGTVTDALTRTGPDTIVHLAAETGTAQSLRAASRHGLVNVVGTTRLLDTLSSLSAPPRHLVLASSRAVYGEGQWRDVDGTVFTPGPRRRADLLAGRWDPPGPTGGPVWAVPNRAGTTPTAPSSVYGATKLTQEHLLTVWCEAMATNLSILRLQNVYGPGQSPANEYAGVLTGFARRAVAGGPIEVYEDGAIIRDFVHVDDATSALVAAIVDPPHGRRLVDVGSGRPTSLVAVAEALTAITGGARPVVSGRFRDGDVRAASCDISAAWEELRWRPHWRLDRGLAALVDAARDVELAAAGEPIP